MKRSIDTTFDFTGRKITGRLDAVAARTEVL